MAEGDFMQGLAALISSGNAVANNISVSKTQKEDRKFMRAENEKNRAFAREMNQYNYNIWKEGLQYDSPVAQYQRYIDAGLNPAYYMGDAQGSGVSSPQSADLTDQFNPNERLGQYQALRSDAINQSSAAAIQLAEYTLKKKTLENETRKLYRIEDITNASISNMLKDGKIKDKQAEELQYKVDEAWERVRQAREVVKRMQYENTPLQYEAAKALQKIENKYYEVENRLEFLSKSGEAYEKAARGSVYHAGMKALGDFSTAVDDLLDRIGVNPKYRLRRYYNVENPYGNKEGDSNMPEDLD